ncbi:MAG: asparaginase [Candidatus Eremiobacteraeota bacterium]|nr:asparaginase [Candidatus Eremiobacteraeota bacterium]
MQLRGEPFVDVVRGGAVESVHHIAACAADARGRVLLEMGSIETPVFLRSSAKPFIAAAVLRSGARERFGLEPHEIAVMAGSHTGQDFHVAAVRSILQKIGMDESALQCGVHAPYNAAAAQQLERDGAEPTVLSNNCSGKHAGILALCILLGADTNTYLELANPAERNILELCARLSDQQVDDFILAVDGCGIPVYATPLHNAAISFARLATLERTEERDAAALAAVRDAMVAHPEFVSGTGEFDSELMRIAGGGLACKAGAEGVHATASMRKELGLVVKVVDGASRGRAPAVLALLHELSVLDAHEMAQLQAFARPIGYNRAGRAIGEVRTADRFIAVEKARKL